MRGPLRLDSIGPEKVGIGVVKSDLVHRDCPEDLGLTAYELRLLKFKVGTC